MLFLFRAENETRTRDPNLGKVVLYQLSYFRNMLPGCSRSLRGMMLNHRFELTQESYIVFEIESQILDLPFEHCDTLDTHAEGKA